MDPNRYRDLGPIGTGGMCEVRRVVDRFLGMRVAMKRLRLELIDAPRAVARFDAEAALTARLQHPGIVAVYDRGASAIGQPWFTMTEVRGDTFHDVLRQAHRHGPPEPSALHRLVSLCLRACETMAYAHGQGVVHRDLKPANLMVGPFGEVLVMDWGLARTLGSTDDTDVTIEALAPVDADVTGMGDVVGTPTYMSPEQARGEHDRLGPPSDVFSLGALLYHLITGRRPDEGSSREVWARRRLGGPTLFAEGHPTPPGLQAICVRATLGDPGERYQDAAQLAEALRSWRDGAEQRAEALRLLEQAREARPPIDAMLQRAEQLRTQAAAHLAPLPPHAPAERKQEAWDLEDLADEDERRAAVLEVAWQRTVGAALQRAPDLGAAHRVLADHYAQRLRAADRVGPPAEVARLEALLADHDRGEHTAMLKGTGALTLVTDPPGAEARLFALVPKHRRLVPEPRGVLGRTPLQRTDLERGSWLVELHKPGHRVVRYPVYIERGEHWHGVRPGSTEPHPVHLPLESDLGNDACYVPAGWFVSGGDPTALDALPRRRVWVDGFAIATFPVTVEAYLAFLRTGPDRSAWPDDRQTCGLVPAADGGFAFRGDTAEWPINWVSWLGAAAYATWKGARLPHELEWAKAARGVDGRRIAPGNHLEPSWGVTASSHTTRPGPHDITTAPLDVSPYAVRGTFGGVRDWCGNPWTREGPPVDEGLLRRAEATVDTPYVTNRGGAWNTVARMCGAAARFADPPSAAFGGIGFRLAWSWPPPVTAA